MSEDRINENEAQPEQTPLVYSFNVDSASQLHDIIVEQGVHLPADMALSQMENIRVSIVTRRLRRIPFDIVKIDDFWFIKEVFHQEFRHALKQGDRLLVINKTTMSGHLEAIDIFKLILHSSAPFIVWVTWDVDTFLNHAVKYRRCAQDNACLDAKAYLLKTKHHEDISLYDHLAYIVADAIQNPRTDMSDLCEKLNYPILRSDLRSEKSNGDLALVKIHAQLLQGRERDSLKSKDFASSMVPDMMEVANYCANAGYDKISTLPVTFFGRVWSAMKRLSNHLKCTEMKFWGKILGLHCDYYIIQIQHEEDIPFDTVDISAPPRPSKLGKTALAANHQTFLPPQQSPNEIPSEPHGTGTNQYTYFVTNSPGLPWMKLPDVKPAMIDHARKIRSFFTGCLSAPVNGFPPFPGVEQDYLRAQIARITASTHISPAGFYILTDPETEDEEEMTISGERKEPTIRINSEFNNDPTNPITVDFLADASLQEWVHSLPEILAQGRTRFWRPPSIEKSTVVSSGEEEETSEDNQLQIPAPLLQPIGDDKPLHTDQMPWSIGLTMSIMHEYSMCYVRSNVWPGAFTLGHAKNYFNLYVGWGQKYELFNPSQPPLPADESALHVLEKNDPSVEMERAHEEARRTAASDLTSEEYTSEEAEDQEEMTEADED